MAPLAPMPEFSPYAGWRVTTVHKPVPPGPSCAVSRKGPPTTATPAVSRIAASGFLTTNIAVALFGLSGVVGKATGLSAPVIVLGGTTFGALTMIVALAALRVSRECQCGSFAL
jgi:hypothetical protein